MLTNNNEINKNYSIKNFGFLKEVTLSSFFIPVILAKYLSF